MAFFNKISISIIVFTVALLVVMVPLLVVYLSSEDEAQIEAEKCYAVYDNSAVVSDDERCNKIGVDMLQKGGSAVDAVIATTLCIGVVNMQASGIAGGMFMTYLSETGETYSLNGRETAPAASNPDMFSTIAESSRGAGSVAVPGQVKGFQAAHEKYGKLPWADLFEPSIDLARHGFTISNSLASGISGRESYIRNQSNHMMIFLHDDGTLRREGETMRDLDLAFSLELIAEDPDSFYTGSLAEDIINDLNEGDGIMTLDDLRNYQVRSYTNDANHTIKFPFFGLDMVLPPAPSSGTVLAFMLGVYDLYERQTETPTVLEYQRVVEIMKWAYGQRSNLGDPYGENSAGITETLANLTSPAFWKEIHDEVNDEQTSNDPTDYRGGFTTEDHGTSHISVIHGNSAASLTSTINLSFGSKLRGRRTGMMYNDQMDDFSYPNITNAFNLAPSPSNFAYPGKRPQSSMCPSILFDPVTKRPMMTLGGAGGTTITTASFLNGLNILAFGMSADYAVSTPRLHHQLLPMKLDDMGGFDEHILSQLVAKGHEIDTRSYTTGSAPVINRNADGKLEAKGDNRRPYSSPAGF